MGHGQSVHPISEPIYIIYVLTIYIHADGATSDTPLAAIPHGYKGWCICITKITANLCLAACSTDPKLGLFPE